MPICVMVDEAQALGWREKSSGAYLGKVTLISLSLSLSSVRLRERIIMSSGTKIVKLVPSVQNALSKGQFPFP